MIGVGVGIPFNRTSFGGAPAFTNTKSLLFDGVDEYVTTSNISALQNVSSFSVSAWVKVNANNDFAIIRRYASGSNAILALYYVGNTLRANISNGAGSDGYANWTPSVGVWYHLAMSYNGGGATNSDKLQIYIDGVSQSLSFVGTLPSTTSNTSGNYGVVASAAYLDGYADEISIFDYSLNATQVTSLYNSGTPTDLDNTSGVTAPVHWWRMGDGDTYPTITDVGTTGGNDGTMTNQESGDIVTVTPPKFSLNSVLFDGVNEYTNVGTIAELNTVSNFSFSFWMKLSDLNYRFPLGTYTLASNSAFVDLFSAAGKDIGFHVRNGSSSFGNATYSFNTGEWYHVAMTYDGGGATNADKLKGYINGANQSLTFTGTIPTTTGTNTDSFDIGRVIASNYFNGNLDDVAIFDYTLSATDVTSIYSDGQPVDLVGLLATPPVHYWKMGDGDTYPTIIDHTGGNNGTMTNQEVGDIVTDTP